MERGTGEALTSAELGDRSTAGELSPDALPPGVSEDEVFETYHELAFGWRKGPAKENSSRDKTMSL
jgi:hypothetical protein